MRDEFYSKRDVGNMDVSHREDIDGYEEWLQAKWVQSSQKNQIRIYRKTDKIFGRKLVLFLDAWPISCHFVSLFICVSLLEHVWEVSSIVYISTQQISSRWLMQDDITWNTSIIKRKSIHRSEKSNSSAVFSFSEVFLMAKYKAKKVWNMKKRH